MSPSEEVVMAEKKVRVESITRSLRGNIMVRFEEAGLNPQVKVTLQQISKLPSETQTVIEPFLIEFQKQQQIMKDTHQLVLTPEEYAKTPFILGEPVIITYRKSEEP